MTSAAISSGHMRSQIASHVGSKRSVTSDSNPNSSETRRDSVGTSYPTTTPSQSTTGTNAAPTHASVGHRNRRVTTMRSSASTPTATAAASPSCFVAAATARHRAPMRTTSASSVGRDEERDRRRGERRRPQQVHVPARADRDLPDADAGDSVRTQHDERAQPRARRGQPGSCEPPHHGAERDDGADGEDGRLELRPRSGCEPLNHQSSAVAAEDSGG